MIIIIIIKKGIKKKTKKKGKLENEEREACTENFYFLFFLLFASFSDLRKSDSRFSSRLKAKLIHALRATRGYQNLGVSSNFTR